MNRKIFYWKLRSLELPLGERTLTMGVLNVTPDSFSDGGLYRDPDRAYARALELEQEGADIIDIGGESTRPGSARISADEEWQRLVPVLKRLRGNLRVPLSLDTYKSEIAERAMDYGVEIINDPSGLTFDANLAKVAAQANAGLILNHMRGTPETWAKLAPLPDAPGAIARDLEATVSRARRAGVEQNRIVIDPGIGFGKRGDQNAEIIAHLGELGRIDLPILVGASRKTFLRQKTDEETGFATAAAVTAAILKGAHIVRVHDVKAMRAAVLVADEIARAAAVQRVSTERPVQRTRPRSVETARQGSDHLSPPRPPLAAAAPPPPAPGAEASSVERPAASREFREPAARDRSGPPRGRDFRDRGPRENKGERSGGDRFRGEQRRDRPARDSRGEDRSGMRPPRRRPDQSRPDQPARDQGRPERFRGDRSRSGPPRGGQDRPPQRDRFSRPAGEKRPERGERPKSENKENRGDRPPKRVFRKRP